ncbi:hypothetical protein MA16_Dca023157 [Dendrobium catenatum]|uniref:Uncharacterized protein n=1 Tax=Dendrobium catenatum TaxID=906689 RepID=A0A2I0V6Y7_9ASPA|nr:hypothetical protein MA16_Dca023157 [Dendrobium catenatum]
MPLSLVLLTIKEMLLLPSALRNSRDAAPLSSLASKEVNCSKLYKETSMGKKAKTSPSIPAKDSAGWLWSFISIFEFSQSYNPHKLPADRKRRTARNLAPSALSQSGVRAKVWLSSIDQYMATIAGYPMVKFFKYLHLSHERRRSVASSLASLGLELDFGLKLFP